MSQLSLYLLGSPRIERDGEPIRVDTRKAVALLAYLALTAESHARDALVSLLWPESDPAHGRAALRRTLHALRRALAGSPQRFDPAAWLDADWETIGLSPQAAIWSDVDQFHRLLAQCRTHGHPASDVCPECVPLLTAAAELHRGDFLGGFSLKDSYAFDDWQFFQAESLRRELADALEKLVRAHIVQAAFEPAIRYARQSLSLDRLNETAHCQLMQLYTWSGQRPAALRQYRECVHTLEGQLGVAPQPATDELCRAIVANCLPGPPVDARFQRPEPVTPAQGLCPGLTPPASEQQPPPLSSISLGSEFRRPATALVAIVRLPPPGKSDPSPDDEAERIAGALALVRECAARYGAQIEPALAGRILAVFGAERTHETNPELAIRAAIEARDAAQSLGLRFAAGISTGKAMLVPAEPFPPAERTWVGSCITNAMQLAEQAQDGAILVAESTAYLTRQAFMFTPLQPDPTEADDSIRVYRAEHLLPRARKAWGLEGLRAELVGRDAELAALRQALRLTIAGRGQMVSLIGEAGVGKTRLVAELSQTVSTAVVPAPAHAGLGATPEDQVTQAPLWLEGRCLELGSAAGYALFTDVLRQVFAWDVREAQSRRYERLAASLQAMAAHGDLAPQRAEEVAVMLGHLLSLPVPAEWSEQLTHEDPQQLRTHRSLAIRDFLIALCRWQPVVLVLEDLHWADSLSIDMIAMLMDELPKEPLLLLCMYRPEREHRCRHLATIATQKCQEAYTEITLRELTREQSRQMLDSLLKNSLPAPARDLILSQAQGNPFYIEEMVHALIDARLLWQKGDVWLAQVDAAPTAIPNSVQSVILSRVDALDGTLRTLLHVAAVIGRVFRRRLLAHMIGQDTELEQALWELEDRALIYQERTVPEVEYSFKHVLLQETIVQSIPPSRRRQLHLKVAGAIEALYPDHLDDYDEQLAHAYEQAGHFEKAIAYLVRAGDRAKRSYANEEGIAHLSKALQLLETSPPSPERDQRELDLRIALGVLLVYVRGHASVEVGATYARAVELCEHVGTPAQRFQVMLGLRRFYFWNGQLLKAHPLGERFLTMARDSGDPLHIAFAYPAQGEILVWLGDFAGCWDHCMRGLEAYDPTQQSSYLALYGNDPGMGCRLVGAMALWALGYPDQALVMSQVALEHAQALSHPFALAMSLYFNAVVLRLRREVRAVQEQTEVLLRISQERRFALYHAWGTALHGWALAQEGARVSHEQIEHGIGEIRKGIAALRSMGATVTLPMSFAALAQACLQVGKLDEAESTVDEALQQVCATGERCWEAELLRLKGELLLCYDRARPAAACFHQAIDAARRQQARSWELRAVASLSRLLQGQGRSPEAHRLLQPVYESFTEGLTTLDLQEAKALLERVAPQ